jgi:WD40 repeat protein
VPRDLETVCLKCLQKEPTKRYARAQDLAADLGRFLAGEPLLARPVGAAGRAWRWARRYPTAVALLTVSAVLLLLLVAGAVALSFDAQVRDLNGRLHEALRDAEDQRDEARARRAEADNQKAAAEAARSGETEQRARAEGLLYFTTIGRAYSAWGGGDVPRMLAILKQCDPQRRQWEWHYLWRLCHSDLRTFSGQTGAVTGVAWSPDGRRVASASTDNTVKVWDTKTAQEVFSLKGHTAPVGGVAWSPDGHHLSSASSDKSVNVWDAKTGTEILTLRGHEARVSALAWSPDSTRLASASQVADTQKGQFCGHLKIWDAKGRTMPAADEPQPAGLSDPGKPSHPKMLREALSFQGHTGEIHALAFSPDGARLASASDDRTVKVWDANTGHEILTLNGHAGPVEGVSWSPDGTRLATAAKDKMVKIWDAKSGQQVLSFQGHTKAVMGVSWSPDGTRLASASEDQAVKLWDATTGLEALTLKGHTGTAVAVSWSPDSTRLASASADGTVKVWDATMGQDALSMKGDTDWVWRVAWSPDGARLAGASGEQNFEKPGKLTVWDSRTGQGVLSHQGHARRVQGVAWSPDGTRLAGASADGTVKVLDTKTGQEVLTLKSFAPISSQRISPALTRVVCGDIVSGVSWGPDGARLAGASAGSN